MTTNECIVSAAHYYEEYDLIIPCVRHCDDVLHHIHDLVERAIDGQLPVEKQGFMTNKKRFVDRNEAMKIAIENNQIKRLVGSQTKENLHTQELFSENLY